MARNAKNSYNTFQKWSVATVFSVYALICIGGIVRSAGAGMGCPDWPKCFGKWVPPTDERQLAADYKEVYKQGRLQKNRKIEGYLRKMGFVVLANEIAANANNGEDDGFNPLKTWIEYLNRLFGVIVGVMILVTGVLSINFWRRNKKVTLIGLLTIVMVGLQGWIGSVVVSTNLSVGIITFHMFMAIAIILLLLYNLRNASEDRFAMGTIDVNEIKNLKYVLLISLFAILVQIYLGTQVREGIDIISKKYDGGMRERWISESRLVYYIHRSFSIIILLSNIAMILFLKKIKQGVGELNFWWRFLIVMTLLEILTGIGMAYFGIPRWLQPIHLTIAIAVIGTEYWIYTCLTYGAKESNIRVATA